MVSAMVSGPYGTESGLRKVHSLSRRPPLLRAPVPPDLCLKEMSSTSIVCDLDGQMSHALDVVRTMEASIVSLNHRRSTRSGHSGGQQLYRGHSHCTNSDCGSPRRWGSSSPGRLSNTRSVGPGAASPIRALRSPANRAQYPSAEKPPDAKSQIVDSKAEEREPPRYLEV